MGSIGSITSNACGLTPSGAAFCWGANGAGQLGDGTTTSRATPVAVTGGHTFTSISVGQAGSCALTAAGAAFCWGTNLDGELGAGTISPAQSTPVQVTGGQAFTAISSGARHSCALVAGGAAYCWGGNFAAQLGNGTTSGPPSTAPVAVTGGLTFAKISAGFVHTCGLTAAGALYCWGSNAAGQLGDGTATDRSTPVPVAGGLTFAGVSAGFIHTCAWTAAGASYCWGANVYGALGIGTSDVSLVPVLITLP